jgi:hypothetical protein
LIIDTERQKLNEECFENQEKQTEVSKIKRVYPMPCLLILKRLQKKLRDISTIPYYDRSRIVLTLYRWSGKRFAGTESNPRATVTMNLAHCELVPSQNLFFSSSFSKAVCFLGS